MAMITQKKTLLTMFDHILIYYPPVSLNSRCLKLKNPQRFSSPNFRCSNPNLRKKNSCPYFKGKLLQFAMEINELSMGHFQKQTVIITRG